MGGRNSVFRKPGGSTGRKVERGVKKAVGKSITNVAREAKNAAKEVGEYTSMYMTGGAVSTDGKTGWAQGGSLTGAGAQALGVDQGKKAAADIFEELSKPEEIEEFELPEETPIDEEPKEKEKDPYLEEELANAKKRGRASTIIGGLTDNVGSSSARKTLFGS